MLRDVVSDGEREVVVAIPEDDADASRTLLHTLDGV